MRVYLRIIELEIDHNEEPLILCGRMSAFKMTNKSLNYSNSKKSVQSFFILYYLSIKYLIWQNLQKLLYTSNNFRPRRMECVWNMLRGLKLILPIDD